jgi:hypothetical protein
MLTQGYTDTRPKTKSAALIISHRGPADLGRGWHNQKQNQSDPHLQCQESQIYGEAIRRSPFKWPQAQKQFLDGQSHSKTTSQSKISMDVRPELSSPNLLPPSSKTFKDTGVEQIRMSTLISMSSALQRMGTYDDQLYLMSSS